MKRIIDRDGTIRYEEERPANMEKLLKEDQIRLGILAAQLLTYVPEPTISTRKRKTTARKPRNGEP